MERLFIVNCWSGKGRGLACKKIIEKWYKKSNIKPIIRLTAADGPNTAFNLGKRAAQEGFERIGIVGGDGTYHLVVSGMMASNVPLRQLPALGLIQAGTGNNFAKNVGTPKNPIEVLKVIENGCVTKVDFGKLILKNEEKYFLNVVSFGFDALITEVAKKFKGKYWFFSKKSHYLLAALGEIIKEMQFYQISVNGQESKEVLLVAVVNGPTYGAIFRITPDADLQDGLFDVCCIDRVEKMKVLADIIQVVEGTHVNLPEVAMSKVSFLTIASQEPLPCEIDGEVLPAEKEYKVEVIPKGLKILTPLIFIEAQSPLFVRTPEFKFA
mgnify:CR=1 FL=1